MGGGGTDVGTAAGVLTTADGDGGRDGAAALGCAVATVAGAAAAGEAAGAVGAVRVAVVAVLLLLVLAALSPPQAAVAASMATHPRASAKREDRFMWRVL